MRTPSGILHVVDFKTDQIVSAIQPQGYWGDKRHWEIKNNIDMLDFTTFDGTKHAITLQQQNLVLKEVRDGRVVPYVITEAEKDSDKRSITTYASGAWVQIAKSGIINRQRIESKTVNEFIDMALLGMKWKRGNTEYAGFHTMTIDEFIDPLTFLKKIASLFDLEIQYRVEVVGSQITGWYVDMVKKRGQETGKEIELGKDLVGVKRIEHSREICTALVGFVRGEEEKIITVESINNGLPYITDSDAFQRWNEHGKHKFGFYTPETEEQNMTPQRLMTLMKTEFKKRVNTSVSYEVEAQSIGRVFGLAHELINEGDTIKIKDTGFTPELYLEARVIAGDESFTDPTQDKYVFGDYREIVDANEELRKIYNRILSSLGNKQEMIDQLDKLVKEANETASNAQKESEAAKVLAEKVQGNIKNNTVEIIESKNPPTTGLKPYKTLWLDISNGKPGILKLWKNGIWDPVVPDVEAAKGEIQKAVDAEIAKIQVKINNKVDQNWVNEQIKDKADKSGVFSKDEIREGFIGKETYQTDKDGNIKKFEEINTSFNQTNEAISQTATKQSVTDLGNNVTGVSKIANEAKTTAEENNRKITSVQSKVDNQKIGVRNTFLKTSDLKHTATNPGTDGSSVRLEATNEVKYRNKEFVISFLVDGKITALGATKKWMGIEVVVEYIDASKDYLSGNIVSSLKLNTDYKNETFFSVIKIKDKDVKSVYGSVVLRDFTGTLTIHHPQLNEGNVYIPWQPAPEDQVSVKEYTTKTTEITESVNGIKENITKVEQNQTGFDKRVTTVEKTSESIKQNVTSLQEIQTNQGKQLQEAKAGWENTAKALEGKVEIKQVENYVAGFKIPDLKQTVDQNKKDLLGELSNKLATEQFNQKMTLIDNRFSINEQGINAAAKKTEVYTKDQANGQFATDSYVRDMESRLQLTEKGVSISVKENDVIAAFNMSKENIKLNAARIDLVGKVKAEWLMAGLLSGCKIRTSNTNNYVSLDDQFLRLYESGVPRAFLGYYRRRDGAVQPTFILGTDEKTSAPEGALFISQMGTGWPQASANIGITDDIVDSEIRKSVFWELNRNGISVLHANDYHALYAGNGNWHFRRGKSGLYQSTLAIEDNSSDADVRLPTITLRNSRVAGYTGVLQVKSPVTQNGWGAVQGNFMSPSLREYKSNIRDVSFSALEKIRNVRVREFNYKNAVNELYKMREEKDPNDPPVTTQDIKKYYGAIVDESDEAFVDESGKGIHLYSYASLTIKALQELEEVQNEKIQENERKHKAEITSMNRKIATLEELVQKLIDKKPEQP
ncbi:phage tail spike protein [Bacillus sp. FDAARGOS_1420]|uniref:phage tail spike protein n=1 Tax=Bacillus sp. FDAARGOS_1420 TaxID=2856338 RepID=UPI001C5A61CD|nr:phage tail spike protein [Bacillus sp. FDAARGOS_1420]MBW3492300.1 phage tail protein [Bacillus sp. FDAARGOS_1420]